MFRNNSFTKFLNSETIWCFDKEIIQQEDGTKGYPVQKQLFQNILRFIKATYFDLSKLLFIVVFHEKFCKTQTISHTNKIFSHFNL